MNRIKTTSPFPPWLDDFFKLMEKENDNDTTKDKETPKSA